MGVSLDSVVNFGPTAGDLADARLVRDLRSCLRFNRSVVLETWAHGFSVASVRAAGSALVAVGAARVRSVAIGAVGVGDGRATTLESLES